MARPFGHQKDPEQKIEKKNENQNLRRRHAESNSRQINKGSETSFDCCDGNSTSGMSSESTSNIYCISNPKFLNYGPIFINGAGSTPEMCNVDASSSKCETSRQIKVRKGVMVSNRPITMEDIQIVSGGVEEDWKKLLRNLPGVTFNNSSFHQNVIDAMDRKDSTNMAEITLLSWKHVLPEFSTIGNLSKTLFSIGHPDIVKFLKP